VFERYTEKARRVIFFARYEASEYGSTHIETEYLLLGLLREDPSLLRRFTGITITAIDIRTEIQRQTTRRERIPTSVEMPLADGCKRALTLAAEEADRLAHRHIGTEHILIGMLRVEGSVAARLLRHEGLTPEAIREQLAKAPVIALETQEEPSNKATIPMKKSDLLRAIQTEIRKHGLSTFMDEKHHVVVPGCPACKKSFGTVEQFIGHISDDVLPPLLDKLSADRK
jgi:ATP-dependent Clp protease ATP-binding subunit ClpC